MKELHLYMAVSECRKLVAAGEPLHLAAKSVAPQFRVGPLDVAVKAAQAIRASRDAKLAQWESSPASNTSKKSATGSLSPELTSTASATER